MIPNVVQFPNSEPRHDRPPGIARRAIIAACWLAIGFGIGIIVTLRVVGFS